MYEENLNLKRERADLLDKITELEYSVQALRGQGVLDLSKENELLKQEIKVRFRFGPLPVYSPYRYMYI